MKASTKALYSLAAIMNVAVLADDAQAFYNVSHEGGTFGQHSVINQAIGRQCHALKQEFGDVNGALLCIANTTAMQIPVAPATLTTLLIGKSLGYKFD